MSGNDTLKITPRTKTNLEVLSNFTNKTLEGQLADQEFSGLLVAPKKACKPKSKCIKIGAYLISRRATVPGRNLWGFLTPPVGF